MNTKYINRKNDEEIINILQSILSNGSMVVETFNESVLVKLMELRGTPLENYDSHRDIDKDFNAWKNNTN